ncbi:cytochrome P450 [Sanghuangporus baumii]|uniref:Cytochrome P450 n=1 Tax=Sanghuangporus baumii TaxID=108892 RepID=A0A9Q5HVJ3_SANBA|nr:cytochrome P450 [Sanghuangporus baumii]
MAHIPTLSLKESLLFDVFCALVVHKIYNKYEVEPANLIATFLLLAGVPALPYYLLVPCMESTVVAVLLAYALFYVSLAVSVILYRISPMHPLAMYPGPLYLKISKLFWMYHASTGKQYVLFTRLHDKYGFVVRIGPNELSIVDVESIPPIIGLRKGPLPTHSALVWIAHGIPGTIPSLPAARDVDVHDQRRKLWNHGFTTSALKELQPAVENRVLELVDELGKRTFPKSGGREISLDLALWMSNFAMDRYDVMGDMVLSGGFSLVRKGDEGGTRALLGDFVECDSFPLHGEAYRLTYKDLRVVGVLQHTPWIIGLIHKLAAVPEGMRKFQEFAFQRYKMRRSQGTATRDLFHYITNEEGLEKIEVPTDQGMNDVLTAIGAGADTTSTVLAAVFFYLLSNPSVCMRLRKEVESEFPVEEREPFDAVKLARMPYLNAVMQYPPLSNEALRLQPPVATSLQRCPLEGSGGVIVAGRLVPESTILYLPPYLHHRDERYFSPSPDSFIPERWLDLDNKKFTTNVAAFIPFSAGRANCVGKSLALMEIRMVVATIVQRFDMEFAEGYDPHKWEEDLQEFFVMKVGKLPVVLRARH